MWGWRSAEGGEGEMLRREGDKCKKQDAGSVPPLVPSEHVPALRESQLCQAALEIKAFSGTKNSTTETELYNETSVDSGFPLVHKSLQNLKLVWHLWNITN